MEDDSNEKIVSKADSKNKKKTVYDYLMVVLVILIVILTINLLVGLRPVKPITTEAFTEVMQENGFKVNEKEDYLKAENKRVGVIVDFFDLINERVAESYYKSMIERLESTKARGENALKYKEVGERINKLHYEKIHLTTDYSQDNSEVTVVRAQNTIVLISANTEEKLNDTLILIGYTI